MIWHKKYTKKKTTQRHYCDTGNIEYRDILTHDDNRHQLFLISPIPNPCYVSWCSRRIGNIRLIHLRVQHYSTTDIKNMLSGDIGTFLVTLSCGHVNLTIWGLKSNTQLYFRCLMEYTLVTWYWLGVSIYPEYQWYCPVLMILCLEGNRDGFVGNKCL